MQEIITLIVIGVAVIIALRMIYRALARMLKKGKGSASGCGCTGECTGCGTPGAHQESTECSTCSESDTPQK